MGFELDSFDDPFTDGAANNARAGGKFRPKAKLRPRRDPSVSSEPTHSTQPVIISENMLTESLQTENSSEKNVAIVGGPPPDAINHSRLMNLLSEHIATGENMGLLGMHTEAIIDFTHSGNAEAGPDSVVVSPADPIAREEETCPGLESQNTMPELTTSHEGQDAEDQSNPEVQFHNETHYGTISNPESAESLYVPDDAGPVNSQTEYSNGVAVPGFPTDDVIDFSYVDPMDPTFEFPVNNEATDFMEASLSDGPTPEEHPETVPEIQEEEASKSLRHRSKRIQFHKLVDESEDKVFEDQQSPAEEYHSGSVNHGEDYQVENEPQQEEIGRGKSKKPVAENGKATRKRKKANEEVSEESSKKKPKKFSHSTRRRKRFDEEWLKTPEDEIAISHLPLKDIILLGEYREWTAKKKPLPVGTPLVDQSTDSEDNNNAFTSQGRESNNEQERETVQEGPTIFNYGTHMKKTPRGRWSKQDTELFYKAVQQFGTDLSMITELFPGRTRNQIKLKYKKEERQHPMRLNDALTNRSKDYSYLEDLAKRLTQAGDERRKNSNIEDSDGFIGEEEPEDVAPENKGDDEKSEQLEDGKSEQFEAEKSEHMEDDVPKGQSPVNEDDDDDFNGWDDYKSEL